jgi:hypothetical protein
VVFLIFFYRRYKKLISGLFNFFFFIFLSMWIKIIKKKIKDIKNLSIPPNMVGHFILISHFTDYLYVVVVIYIVQHTNLL